jgi:hypothetical protein
VLRLGTSSEAMNAARPLATASPIFVSQSHYVPSGKYKFAR